MTYRSGMSTLPADTPEAKSPAPRPRCRFVRSNPGADHVGHRDPGRRTCRRQVGSPWRAPSRAFPARSVRTDRSGTWSLFAHRAEGSPALIGAYLQQFGTRPTGACTFGALTDPADSPTVGITGDDQRSEGPTT